MHLKISLKIFLLISIYCTICQSLNNTIDINKSRNVRKNLFKTFFKTKNKKDGTLRLVGGRTNSEGNVEVLHNGRFGGVCDDEWSKNEAEVVCRSLGFPAGGKATHSSQFGKAKRIFWMDNVKCNGNEKELIYCKFDGWAQHDCEPTESAGVICNDTTILEEVKKVVPSFKKIKIKQMDVRIEGGRTVNEGRVEVKIGDKEWGSICGNGFSLVEANVICKQLNLGYAYEALQTDFFGTSSLVLSGTKCIGNEPNISDCHHHVPDNVFCESSNSEKPLVAAVVCRDKMADLVLDYRELEQTAHLEDRPMYFLQCAMEENCVASHAYEIQKENPSWHLETRRLLKFTAAALNNGTADFRPHIPKEKWEWHTCHMHYHSMEVFASFDITSITGEKIADGHKASFCLEDNRCAEGTEPRYACANYGDQGISVNCTDIYKYNIDCQWIDITEIDFGQYLFRVAINPEFKVPEMSFENNAAVCTLTYTETHARVYNCHMSTI